MAKIKANLKELDHAEWLKQRAQSIGGSNAAAALGVDPYKSRLELWAEKTGKVNSPFEEDSERKRLGRELEGYAAERFAEVTGKELRIPEAMYVHEEFDFLTANLDREVVGENAGLECRTTTRAFEDLPDDFSELPKNLLAQCYHYLAVMEFEKIYLAVLDLFSGKLKIYEIPYDAEKCGELINAEKSFWYDYVLAETAPAPDGSDSAEEVLKALAEPIRGNSTDLESSSELIGELFELRKKIKEYEVREKQLRQEIILQMGDNQTGFTENFRVDLTRQNRKIVDTKNLKENYAEVYAACLKNSTANILKISEI